MPIFRFKLEDTETGAFRIVSVAADSMEEAEETIYRQEMKKVNFSLPDNEYDALSALEEEGALRGRDKGKLFSHRQLAPYKTKKGVEVEGGES